MIFVTVGTERFQFNRLMRAVDDVLGSLSPEPVFVQTGACTHIPACPNAPLVPFKEFARKIHAARVVVAHAGVGTFVMCAQQGKVPIMMARKGRLGEHVDDHQQMLAERFARAGRILLVDNEEELRTALVNYAELCTSAAGSFSKGPSLASHLGDLLRDIEMEKAQDCR